MAAVVDQRVTDSMESLFKVPHRITMGLAMLHEGEAWFEMDGEYAADLREKERLLREERAQVLVETSSSRPAQREIRDALAAHLCERYPAAFSRRGRALFVAALDEERGFDEAGRTPIECASRWVQEDLCVMERTEQAWVLSAASVCFPTRWDLPSKLGLPLTAIHDPVPGYAEQLALSADRFFERMKPGRTVWRNNWALTASQALFQPSGHGRVRPIPAVNAENAGDRVWIRAERQTLTRFPRCGAILFTIRVHRTPLRALRSDAAGATALIGALRTMDPALHRYKSLVPLHEAVIAYLS